MLKLTIAVPLGSYFVGVLAESVACANLDDAQRALQKHIGESYALYRGGSHIAIHERVNDRIDGPRLAMIQEG